MNLTEDQDDPEEATVLDSVIATLIHVALFGLLIPWITALIANEIWNMLTGASLSGWISFVAIGLTTGVIAFEAVRSTGRTHVKVAQGHVQFMRCDIPGIDHSLKLYGGLHIIPLVYSKWNEAWAVDVKWQVNTTCMKKDETGKEKSVPFRVSVGSKDYLVSAVATVRPETRHLLPLHLLSNDGKTRQEIAVSNLRMALMREIEETLSNAVLIVKISADKSEEILGLKIVKDDGSIEVLNKRGESTPYIKEDDYEYIERGFIDIGEVVGYSQPLSTAIQKEFRSGHEPIVKRYGLIFDTFSLGTIDSPPEEEKGRDIANRKAVMSQTARETYAKSGDKSMSEKEHERAQMVMAKDITESEAYERKGLDAATIAMVEKIAPVLIAAFAQRNTPPQTAAPANPNPQNT